LFLCSCRNGARHDQAHGQAEGEPDAVRCCIEHLNYRTLILVPCAHSLSQVPSAPRGHSTCSAAGRRSTTQRLGSRCTQTRVVKARDRRDRLLKEGRIPPLLGRHAQARDTGGDRDGARSQSTLWLTRRSSAQGTGTPSNSTTSGTMLGSHTERIAAWCMTAKT